MAGKCCTKQKQKNFSFIVLVLLLLIMYGTSFKGVSTIFFMLSGIVNSYAVIFLKEQGIRIGTIIAALVNIIAFISINSFASVIGEVIVGLVAFISVIKFRKRELIKPDNIIIIEGGFQK